MGLPARHLYVDYMDGSDGLTSVKHFGEGAGFFLMT